MKKIEDMKAIIKTLTDRELSIITGYCLMESTKRLVKELEA